MSLTRKESEEAFDLLMSVAENGLEYAVKHSGYGDLQTHPMLAAQVADLRKAQAALEVTLKSIKTDEGVLAVADANGTQNYSVLGSEEFLEAIENGY